MIENWCQVYLKDYISQNIYILKFPSENVMSGYHILVTFVKNIYIYMNVPLSVILHETGDV
jgi:hypothetical protein